MPRTAGPMSDQTNLQQKKKKKKGTGTGPQRQLPARQRQPTEKVSTVREEMEAAAIRREVEKARKAKRANRALENSDDDQDVEVVEHVTAFKTHSVPTKSVTIKTKALANKTPKPKPAPVPSWIKVAPAPTPEDIPDQEVQPAPEEGQVGEQPELEGGQVGDEEPAGDDEAEDGDDDEDDDDEDDDEDVLDESQSSDEMVGLKRRPSSTDSLKETKVRRTSSGRPKAADYDDSTKAILLAAISYYRANLSSYCAFPDITTEASMLAEIWKATLKIHETSATLTPQIAKLITSRGSQLRGELKSKTRPLVEGFFGFESGLNRKIIAKNRDTAENLKDGKGFVYKIPDVDVTKRKGLYQSKIIQKVVNGMWFRNKQDEGIVHEENFNPLTIEALALVLSAIECCIDEWISGIRTDIPFSTALYKDVYEDHINCLLRFNKITKEVVLTNILVKLYNRGRFHAGATPISRATVPSIADSAFHAALKEYEDDPKTESDGENGGSD